MTTTTTHPMIRVLVVDDSAFARKVLRESLTAHPRIEVVGIARDGLDALEKIAELKPDVVTLDLSMPHLDGAGVLATLRDMENVPAVVVVSIAGESSEAGTAALQAGAFDVVQKPTALATDRLYDVGKDLVAAVLAAADARASRSAARPRPTSPPPSISVAGRTRIVVIGTSTGGPQALTQLIRMLPADFPVPVAVVVHMPPGYTESFAARLDGESALSICEARDGLRLGPRQVVIARAGMHLRIAAVGPNLAARLDVSPLTTPHRPAVDVLFQSAVDACGAGVLGVVLTGMGNDGLVGARAIRAAGGTVLTETEASCVVYGMPRAVFEDGMSSGEASLDGMAALIAAHL